MRYTAQIERALIEQIEREPDRPVILPDWAYWKGGDAAYIDRDGERIPLIRHLYEVIIQPLGRTDGLANDLGVPPRNVNPRLAIVLPTRWSRVACPKCGTRYRDKDYKPDVGQRCHPCAEARRGKGKNMGQRNKAKTHCPNNHPLIKGNLVKLKSKKRRCLICHRDTQRLYREKRES